MVEFGSPDCLRDSLFPASSSQLPSSRLSPRRSHRRSASPRPSLDRRNADAGTAAPSHHQATTREIGRGNRQPAEVCRWTENAMASFQDSAASRCLGRRRHWAGALSPSLQHPVIPGAPSLPPGMRQRALGILPPGSLPQSRVPLSRHKQPHVEVAFDRLDNTNHQPSLSPVEAARASAMYQHVRPSHLERHLLGVFLLPSADQVLDTSHITGRPPTAALRKPGDVDSWPGNGSRLLIAHPAPSVAEACKNAICSLA